MAILEGGLLQVFDRSYAHFWAEELGGDRLKADISRIWAACRLRSPMRVLDLGCGYGRIANRLAAEGLVVTALDQSADLLDLARRAASDPPPEFIEGDMRALEMRECFDAVLLWFSTFGYFDELENAAVLTGTFRCLRPGGRLAIETRNWDRIHREFEPWSVRMNGDDVLMEKHQFVPATGRQETRQVVFIGGRRYERSYFLRRYTAAELGAMLRKAGFSDVAVYGEDMTPLTIDHKRAIFVAERG